MKRSAITSGAIIVCVLTSSTIFARSSQPRQLSIEDRVRAQEAIERVYYSHQIGTTRPFEEAFPHEVLEAKVRTYLKQSVALEGVWNSPITGQSLRAELDRIARNTRFPERLEEVYAALHRDPVLVLECFVRPTLASRLSRNFYAYDERIHGSAKSEAESLRQQLVRGEIDLAEKRPERTVLDASLVQETSTLEGLESRHMLSQAASDEPRHIDLNPEGYQRLRHLAPDQVGEVGDVIETREEFVARVLLSETEGRMRLASYTVPKTAWDTWWSQVHQDLDEHSVETLEIGAVSLPEGATSLAGDATPVSQPCVPDDTWDNGSLDDVPDGRGSHSGVWTGSLMIVWGGYLVDDDSGGRYDPLTDTWTPTSLLNAPSGRYEHSAIWTGSLMVVWGGTGRKIGWLNSGGRYDPLTDRWTPTSTLGAPSARSGHGAVWTGSVMVVWGTFGTSAGGRYDPITDTWVPTSTLNAPSPRAYPKAVWTGSRMIVWGGLGGSSIFGISTGGQYDPVSDTWTPTSTSNAPTGRYLHTAVWTGTEMIVWGGSPNTPVNTGGRYNPLTDTWTATSTNGAPSARYDHAAVWTGNRMVVWGGTQNSSFGINTGGRYDPITDTWTPTSTLNAPSARSQHTAVWTGGQIVVWGGFGSQTTLNTGGRYDPINDVWTPTRTLSGPSIREMHTTVWTGSLMIVWGGDSGLSALNTGGRYDPLTDTWSDSSSVGAPAARFGHTAVWTGNLMIVWGGYSKRAYSRDGGRYDPVSDTWTPTSLANAPAALYGHTAVWTGREMIVWGGDGSPLSDFPTTGGRYNPITDAWSPTSTIDAPEGRWSHAAVWTGSRMIIYGGYNDGSIVFTGARYDPVADTWAPTSTLNAPQTGSFLSAVWTGDRMIVWGGHLDTHYFDTGGLYDPISDTWTPTSSVNAPYGRSQHTAVWTGSVMIVWGGYNWPTDTFFDTGGRYNPTNDTWIPTSTMGAASDRFGHTAVWTGSQMIVWGGHGLVSTLGSGGRYYLGLSTDDDGDGASECAGDCNDSNPAIHPGVSELCDGLDNDCDGATDEGLGPGTVEVSIDQATLWPPNHRMVDLRATVIVNGGCPAACPAPPDIVLASITSNEPDDAAGIGDGQTVDDIQGASVGTADFDFSLRAERDGADDGRLYQAAYVVTDCFGDTAVGYGGVFVPHDESGETEPLLMDVVALPGGSADGYALEWNSIPQATEYNVLRGRISSIHAVGLLTVIDDAGCLARGLTSTSLSGGLFEEDPAPGEGYFYLAEYVKGVPSGYGTESGSREMVVRSGDSCH